MPNSVPTLFQALDRMTDFIFVNIAGSDSRLSPTLLSYNLRVMRRERAFGVAEVLVALGFLAVILVTVASLIISTAKATDESGEIAPALLAARQIAEQTRSDLRTNPDSAESQDFWDNEYPATPWKSEQVQIGSQEFSCRVFTLNVRNSSGDNLGGRPENLLKKVRIVVDWDRGEERGYGKLSEELVTLFARQ